MNIVFCANLKYLIKTGVVITSILFNNPKESFNFYIFSADISLEDLKIFEKLKKRFPNFSVQLITVDNSSFKDLPINLSHISLETYFRWLIPQYLANEDKALYIDVDTIVLGNLQSLYNIDLTNNFVAAASELYADQINYKEQIGLHKNDLYVNAGVLLMNLDLWRQEKLASKLFEKAFEIGQKATYMDQDILNIICQNRIKEISPKFNYTMAWIKAKTLKLKDIVIIHYTGNKKPWGYKKVHLSKCWKKYAHIFSKITSIKGIYPSLWEKITSKRKEQNG
jgi:lipopolysaccharide biosynthesis glycosyltransferase